jgi:RimK-like ATP-grasp domain
MSKIYLIGLDSDRTFCYFANFAVSYNINLQVINLRSVIANGDWQINLPADANSWLKDATNIYELDPLASYYCRLINLASVQSEIDLAQRWQGLIFGLTAYLEQIPGTVINRPNCRSDNNSKPLHELALQYYGLKVAPSITSSDPVKLTEFAQAQKAIVKPISGIRADSRLVSVAELENFHPQQGPIHLQQFISGDDVRVHVVGDQYQAELIECPTVDYRLDYELAQYFPNHQIPPDLAERLIKATKAFGLCFAGWDFKRTAEGEYWCLEANPMPGYDGYDRRCEGKISQLLIEFLSVETPQAIASNSNPHQILTTEQCDQIYQQIESLRQYWLPRGSETSLFCTLGAASYLDCGDYFDAQDTYWQKASRYNPLLLKHFGWLYKLVKEYLETQLNAPVNYRSNAAYPGFHLWLSQAIPTLPVASMHFDLQYQYLSWENQDDIDFSNTFSFTLPIQLPASGGGLNLCDLNYLEYLNIRRHNQIDWDLIPRFRNQNYHPYQVGEIVMHSGHTMHQIAPTSVAKVSDRRVTFQGHGVYVDDTWQIYW